LQSSNCSEQELCSRFVGLTPLSSRPERHGDRIPARNLWRGVEGPRGSILRHAAFSESRAMRGIPIAARKLRGREPPLEFCKETVARHLLVTKGIRRLRLGIAEGGSVVRNGASGSLHSAPGMTSFIGSQK